jgi:hypothetical protein
VNYTLLKKHMRQQGAGAGRRAMVQVPVPAQVPAKAPAALLAAMPTISSGRPRVRHILQHSQAELERLGWSGETYSSRSQGGRPAPYIFGMDSDSDCSYDDLTLSPASACFVLTVKADVLFQHMCQHELLPLDCLMRCSAVSKEWQNTLRRNLSLLPRLDFFAIPQQYREHVTLRVVERCLSQAKGPRLRVVDLCDCPKAKILTKSEHSDFLECMY